MEPRLGLEVSGWLYAVLRRRNPELALVKRFLGHNIVAEELQQEF